MKPRVWSGITTPIERDESGRAFRDHENARREWMVDFDDGCGCVETEHFRKFPTALRFAYHVGCGGSRWEFVA